MMNKFHFLSLFFFIFGIIFIIIGYFSGEVEIGFFIIFPFIIGSGINAFLGFIFIFIAILFFMFSFAGRIILWQGSYESNGEEQIHPKRKPSVKGGGVVLIGPNPIVFGSNWKIAIFLMIISIILIIITFLTFKTTVGL